MLFQILVARGRFEFGFEVVISRRQVSPLVERIQSHLVAFTLAPMLCIAPSEWFDHYTTGLPKSATEGGVS